MLALAVARPLWGPQPLAANHPSGDSVRIVLVDVSQSMAATVGATQQIAQARTLAANQYLQYETGLWANLVLAGATPRTVFDGPSTNFETLRDELSRCQALPERLDVKAALERAAQMLAPTSEQDKRRRELVIFSDFQALELDQGRFLRLARRHPDQARIDRPQELGAGSRERGAGCDSPLPAPRSPLFAELGRAAGHGPRR